MTPYRPVENITFHQTSGPEGLNISRVKPHRIEHFAPKILGVLHGAYSRRFVDELGLLTQAAVDKQFAVGPETVARQIAKMNQSMRAGSAYWVARPGSYANDEVIVGIAKASPSKPKKLKSFFKTPNLYLDDIDSVEEHKGIGSALIYAATSEYEDSKIAVLDAVEGNDRTNQWFESLGFMLKPEITLEPLVIGGEAMPQIRYENLSVGGLRTALLANKPWLWEGAAYPPSK